MWQRLAPLVAARRSARLWDPVERVFERTGISSLPRRVPVVPAAVPIFDGRGYTTLLALDFDAKKLGAAAVDADVACAREWLVECGARIVEDRSTSGGAHLLVPLYAGTPHRIRHVTPVLRLLANRLPTLDLSPMSNDRTGCITPPGSACREGGHRRLVGELDDAVDALTVRSQQGLVARLLALLGDLTPQAPTRRASMTSTATPIGDDSAAIAHAGTDRMCVTNAPLPATLPLPPVVAAFAAHGSKDARWKSPSEARQSVLAQAAMRGLSLADVQHRTRDGSWAGLAAAYDRYAHQRAAALARDWTKACRYVVAIASEVRSSGHRYWNTGGLLEGAAFEQHRAWLAQAVRWVDATWPRSAKRWTALAVLQAVAYMAAIGGENVNGTLVVAVGGRTLSTEAAMMPETTLWDTLAELRDSPGSPLLRTRRGAGLLPDAYALVTPRDDHGDPITATTTESAAARIEPVHAAWRTLGLHTRRLYEAIVHTGLTRPDDAFEAARIGRTAGYDALATLSTAGVIEHRRNELSAGQVSLDAYAARRRTHEIRADRIERHRLERALWRDWLELRFAPPPPDDGAPSSGDELDLPLYDAAHASIDDASWADLLASADAAASDPPNREPVWTAANNPVAVQQDETWWAHVGAEATPPSPEHAAAVAIVTTVLGAEVVPT